MKIHERVKSGINILPMLEEVVKNWSDFELDTSRQENIDCQKETQTIQLIAPDYSDSVHERGGPDSCRYTDEWIKYPRVQEFLEWFAETYHGQLYRVSIVHLPSGGKVYRHADEGAYYEDKHRFHLVLSGYYDVTVIKDTEKFKAGELWTFNNKKVHEVANNSPIPRVAVIFDVKGWERKSQTGYFNPQ